MLLEPHVLGRVLEDVFVKTLVNLSQGEVDAHFSLGLGEDALLTLVVGPGLIDLVHAEVDGVVDSVLAHELLALLAVCVVQEVHFDVIELDPVLLVILHLADVVFFDALVQIQRTVPAPDHFAVSFHNCITELL